MAEISSTLINLVRVRVGDNKNTTSPVFDVENIKAALELSLRAFNMVPVVTYFKWDDVETIDMISDLLVTYAGVVLLQSAAIVERGREFKQEDGGVSFTPPSISDMAFNLSIRSYDNWLNQVTLLKSSDSFYDDFVEDSSDNEV